MAHLPRRPGQVNRRPWLRLSPPGGNIIVEFASGQSASLGRSVLSRIRIRAGQPFDAELIRQDVQLLLQSRRYDSVTTCPAGAGGGVILTFAAGAAGDQG